ncbi:MAG: hypothetical protein ABSD58_18340, partial [Verrucomicrobiia bacterium]
QSGPRRRDAQADHPAQPTAQKSTIPTHMKRQLLQTERRRGGTPRPTDNPGHSGGATLWGGGLGGKWLARVGITKRTQFYAGRRGNFFWKAKNEANCRRRLRLGGAVGKGGLRENTFLGKTKPTFPGVSGCGFA